MSAGLEADRLLEVVVPDALEGERVDKSVSLLAGVSRSVAARLVAEGRVSIDGRPAELRSRPLASGERLEVRIPPVGEDLPVADPSVVITVVHEDDDLIVVDKPAGLVVHAGAGNNSATLVCGLLARYPELAGLPRAGAGDPHRPGIVHRLDKGTSGLLAVARSVRAYRSLARQFREHSAGREYVALVAGSVSSDAGVVDAPIGRSARHPERMAVTRRGREATTSYRVAARYRDPVAATLVHARLGTGRTHQVRVHFAAIGHPVVGDDRYGGAASRPAALVGSMGRGRLFLHAHELELEHPAGGKASFSAPLPADLARVLDRLTP
ncbi:MAG TPA: RluA family pseudouridine synthase [Acidimicrobiales bacterium]|nr:RluA family pseudouridine synthase [Acidimicrobiales bacterium]